MKERRMVVDSREGRLSPRSGGDAVELLLADDTWSTGNSDVLSVVPGLTVDQAYGLQFAQMARRVAAGDRIVGYKAANTSLGAQRLLSSELPVPTVGTLLASCVLRDGGVYEVRSGTTYVEAEVAAVLASRLRGPGLTRLDAARAVEWLCPAIEIAAWSPAVAAGQYSAQHTVATHKTVGGVVIGDPLSAASVPDLRLEGALLEIDGDVVGSRTAVEAMGHPLDVVAAIAGELHRHGLALEPGMVVMTGSLLPPLARPVGARCARASFTRLGDVSIRFADSNVPPSEEPDVD